MSLQRIDSLGTWKYLGLIHPFPGQWTFFPADVVDSETIQFEFIADWTKVKYPYASYCLIRLVYQTAELTVGPVSRMQPGPERQIREFKVPDEIKAKGIVTRAVSIKRVLKSRYVDLPDLDAPWGVEAEYLVNT